MSVATVLLKERRMIRRFLDAGAASPESARSLDQVGVSQGRIMRRLRERLVLRQIEGDRFYVDQEAWDALRRRRRRHASVAAILALALILAILLFTKTAHAGEGQAVHLHTSHRP